jgi:uncharacterized protein (TIGR02186 family)
MIARALLFAALLAAAPAAAEEVVAGLSRNQVAITASFDGSDILIYGAVKREAPIPDAAPLQVIVTVEGPSTPITVRRKSRQAGIWINTASVAVDSAPSFYEVTTTGPFDQILSATEDLRHRISVPQMIRSVGAPQEITDSKSFTEALIRIRTEEGDYRMEEGGVQLLEQTLFRADIDLPANLIEGRYVARIFLVRDEKVIDTGEEIILVKKVGIERWVNRMARNEPESYGVIALLIAALAGWGASAAFRFIRA